MVPCFLIQYKRRNVRNDEKGIKTLYISDNQKTEEYCCELSGVTAPFYEGECGLDLGPDNNGSEWEYYFNVVDQDEIEENDYLLSAYPHVINLDELKIMFPNCSFINMGNSRKLFEMSELGKFPNLRSLNFYSLVQTNLNGIEFLDSLQELVLGRHYKGIFNDVEHCDSIFEVFDPPIGDKVRIGLSQLNLLKLLKLAVNRKMMNMENLNIETLEELDLQLDYQHKKLDNFGTLTNISLPNLKLLKLNVAQHNRLSEFNVPDECRIHLTTTRDLEKFTEILETARKNIPNAIIELVST
jgi:hypothetical protein